jgi:hypothetical protein
VNWGLVGKLALLAKVTRRANKVILEFMTDLTNVQFSHKFYAILSFTIHIQNVLLKSIDIFIVIFNDIRAVNITVGTVGCKKKGNENVPNVNLILSICQLIVYLTIPIK